MEVNVGLERSKLERSIDAFKLWCWRLMRKMWITKKQTIQQICPEFSFEVQMIRLKLNVLCEDIALVKAGTDG